MASRKLARTKRFRRQIGSLPRMRRSHIPLLESLENRLVLSGQSPHVSSIMDGLAIAGAIPQIALADGLVPIALANGGTAWLQPSGAMRLQLPTGSGSS